MVAITHTPVVGMVSIGSEPFRSDRCRRTRGVSTRCTATSGNGAPTGTVGTPRANRSTRALRRARPALLSPEPSTATWRGRRARQPGRERPVSDPRHRPDAGAESMLLHVAPGHRVGDAVQRRRPARRQRRHERRARGRPFMFAAITPPLGEMAAKQAVPAAGCRAAVRCGGRCRCRSPARGQRAAPAGRSRGCGRWRQRSVSSPASRQRCKASIRKACNSLIDVAPLLLYTTE